MTASPSAVDEGIADVRDNTWPAIRDMEGCVGLSMLVDRESVRLVVSTAWESKEALRASREKVLPLRARASDLLGTGTPVIDEWEIVSMHRVHATRPGSPVRTTLSRVNPANVERAQDYYKSTLLPQLEKLDGFASASLLLKRSVGSSALSVAFDTREALEATRDEADYLRAQSSRKVHVEFLDFAEFELVLADFHVPDRV